MSKTAMPTAAAAVLILAGGLAKAAEVEVKQINKGVDGGPVVFEPAFVKIAPGDTVKFVAAAKGQSADAIKRMLPEGATLVAGENSGDFAVKFGQEGVYGVKCLPHYGICMVVMVGAPARVDHAKVGKVASK
jgi:pseudoazurin